MAIEEGVTEIADSEDDPIASSPGVVPDEAADKLCAGAGVPYQERQDALHGADSFHQAFAQRDANAASCSAEGLDGDRDDVSVDDASKIDQTNMTLHDTKKAPEEGSTNELGSQVLEMHPKLRSPKREPMTGAKLFGPNVVMMQALPMIEPQHCEDVPARRADTEIQQDKTYQTTKDDSIKRSDMKAVGDAVVKDVENDPLADLPERPSIAGGTSPAREEQATIESIHPTVLDNPSQALTATEQHPSDASVHVEVSDRFTSQSQDRVPRDSLFPGTSNDGSQAADHYSGHRYSNENAAHTPVASTATSIWNSSAVTVADASDDKNADYAAPKLSLSSAHHDAQSPGTTLCSSQIDTDTSEAAMSARESSSMIDDLQTLPRESTEQHRAVEQLDSSKQSADHDSVAGSPTAEPPAHVQSHTGARCMDPSAQVSPSKTPQETVRDELRAQKAALLASLGSFPAIQVLIEEHALSDVESGNASDVPIESDIMAAANKIVKEHIKLLHEYNELKDMGQGLMGLIADQRGTRIVEVQEEFGIEAAD
ncbi:hypothetical protein ACET3X_008755 [Alternaria dauci]|uniref:Swi5-domain-containing protein n=1 Tax=Alternaria dauci TaxID=48095 RepID=A0ABR3UBA2_9PLEO